ncbi:prolyl 4-hydroxylase subunit alpha-1-like isoform X2 [Argopecten irradians]|uniref:prolyl 4-hydroxylase subunit alpha-1-like isoform X2 n=1 Tax=Argopecten irradians TaxID=31199 RepID=UPI003715FA48
MATQDFNSAWKRITNEYGIWTSSEDLNIARTGLERLHQVYSFDLKEMITGTIYNLTTSPLTIGDVISITKALAVEKRIKWYEAFLELDSVTEKKSILYKLAIDYHMTGMSRKALDILTDLQKTSTRPMGSLINMIRQKAESSKQTVDQENSELTEEDIMDNTYRQLCQGLIQRDVYEPALFCYHTETNIPYYRIKEEVLSYIPRISRFHDIISDSEIAHLQITVKQNLKRARVWHKGVAVYVDSRTGESAQVKKTITCVKLEKRIELITGLDLADRQEIKTAETLHVVNYGIGGHYERHYDFFDVRNSPDKTHGSQNDRIATWMFYLNNVKAGGATVFPKINLRILPIKGSAVLWYNLLPSGEIDERSQHAACPVILGTKWVSTKWVREFGQELRKPCGLHPMAEHS